MLELVILLYNILRDSVAKTLFLTHPDCLRHETGPSHPERPERLDGILEVLDAPLFSDLIRIYFPN